MGSGKKIKNELIIFRDKLNFESDFIFRNGGSIMLNQCSLIFKKIYEIILINV